jgi:threonine aldolase
MNYAFASDNTSAIHPQILEAIRLSNHDFFPSYSEDSITHHAQELFRHHFGDQVKTFFVTSGTAANVLGLKHILKPYEGVICSDMSHIYTDECGASENQGIKLFPVKKIGGNIDVSILDSQLTHLGFTHRVQPKVLSLTQSTYVGTVYSKAELKTLCQWAHDHDLYVHMDGARFSNAAVSLGVSLKEISTDVGVDILSYGGTKNGAMAAEAVIFLNPELGDKFSFTQKQGMQLISKSRFIAAQFVALLTHDLWKENATHANQMAQKIAQAVEKIKSLEFAYPCEANCVLVKAPGAFIETLRKKYIFHTWDQKDQVIRWMTSFQNTSEQVDQFIKDIQEAAD